MKTPAKIIAALAELPTEELLRLERRIMERALALCSLKEFHRRPALEAVLQAEQRMLAHFGEAALHSPPRGGSRKPTIPAGGTPD